jgi:hypothetical protein
MMVAQNEEMAALDLTETEIKKLPARVRSKIEAALGEKGMGNARWVLVRAGTGKQAAIIQKTVRTMNQIVMHRRQALSEKNIEQLVDLYLEGEERPEVDEEIELDNAQLRAAYLQATRCFTSQQIHDRSSRKPKNKSEPASRWKREQRVFAVRQGGVDLYPAFQFRDGAPRRVVKKTLACLPNDLSAWQIAFWFASGNAWLDDAAPQDCLSHEADVIAAAARMSEIAIG